MIVATTPDGGRFYSNDAQLFSDGEVTIYSPQWLPKDSALTSTELSVTMVYADNSVSMQVRDVDSGHIFWSRDGLSTFEALELAEKAFDEYSAKEQ